MTWMDYGIPGIYLIALFVIAWHFRKTQSAPEDFFLGGRNFKALPIGLSVMVTTFSAVNFLAFSGEVYGHGLYVLASLPVFFLAAIPITRCWIPYVLQKRPVSIYAILEERFDYKVRALASALFLVWRLFWMAVALYASCKIMSALTGHHLLVLLMLCGVAATAYSAVGGLRAVIWTDVMQFTVLIGSIVAAVALAWIGNDFTDVLVKAGKFQPLYPVDWNYFSLDPSSRITFWSALIGTFVTFLTRYGADQMVMQRCLAAASPETAKRGVWINAFASTAVLGLLVLFGLAAYIHAQKTGMPSGAPPLKVIASLLRSLPTGISGLIAAGLLAATMSSIDSGLNSCCAALKMDFSFARALSPKIMTVILAVPVIAAAALILPVLNQNNTLFVILNKTVNAIGTPLLAMMLCIFWKKLKASALFYGGLIGIILTVLCSLLLQNLALHYYAVLSLAITLIAVGLGQIFFRR